MLDLHGHDALTVRGALGILPTLLFGSRALSRFVDSDFRQLINPLCSLCLATGQAQTNRLRVLENDRSYICPHLFVDSLVLPAQYCAFTHEIRLQHVLCKLCARNSGLFKYT